MDNRRCFSESEATTASSIKSKPRKKTQMLKKKERLNWNQPKRHIENYTFTVIPLEKKIQPDDKFDHHMIFSFGINPQNDPARRQVKLYHTLIVNLVQKGNSPFKQEFHEVKIRRQYSITILQASTVSLHIITSQSSNQPSQRIQTDDIESNFS